MESFHTRNLILLTTCMIFIWTIKSKMSIQICWSSKMVSKMSLSILIWTRSIQRLIKTQSTNKLVFYKSMILIHYLERDQTWRAPLTKRCLWEDLRRASNLIRETTQCLSQLIVSKSMSTSTASLSICRRSITPLIIFDLSSEWKPMSDLW